MTTTLADLLAEILANPADDAPRLIYADLAEELGDSARGEFIRVQVELAPFAGVDLEAFASNDYLVARYVGRLRRREQELLDLPIMPQLSAFAWSQPLYDTGIALGRPWRKVFTFCRGFVVSLVCTWEDFCEYAAAIIAQQPIETVRLTSPPNMVGWLVKDGQPRTAMAPQWPGITFTLPPRLTMQRILGAESAAAYLAQYGPPTG